MTDGQMITIALAIIASLGAVIYNNARITDLRDALSRRFDDARDSMNKRFDDVNRHIEDKHAVQNIKLDHIIEMLATQNERITKLEST